MCQKLYVWGYVLGMRRLVGMGVILGSVGWSAPDDSFFSIGTRRKVAVKESINPWLSCRFSWNSLGECLKILRA